MKKILLLLGCLFFADSYAFDFESDGIYYNILSKKDATCEVTFKDASFNSYSGSIILPNTVEYDGKEYTICQIGTQAFSKSTNLQSVIIPEGYNNIKQYAFSGCENLESVQIGTGLTSIESHAFSQCSSLTSVKLPDSIQEMGESAFGYCKSLESIMMPESLQKLGINCFQVCSSLNRVNFTCDITEIPDGCFWYCESLSSIQFPTTLKTIGEDAFAYNKALKVVELPESLLIISKNAFMYSALKEIIIPNKVESIGFNCFYGCRSITNVQIGENCKVINEQAFEECGSINYLTIGKSMEKIGSRAFRNCTEIKKVTCYATKRPSLSTDAFNSGYQRELHVYEGYKEEYEASANWAKFHIYDDIPFIKLESIEFTNLEKEYMVGTEGQITYSCMPKDAVNQEVSITSSNPSVVYVEPSGKFYCMQKGFSLITITSLDNPDIYVTAMVKVIDETEGISTIQMDDVYYPEYSINGCQVPQTAKGIVIKKVDGKYRTIIK